MGALTRWCIARPRTVLVLAALVAMASLALAGAWLELRTSNLDLVDPELPEVARFRDFAHEFGTPNVLVVGLEGEDPERLYAVVDRLAPRLREVSGVLSVVDRLPVDEALLAQAGLDPYLTSDSGELALLLVQPDDPDSRAETLEPFVAAVRSVVDGAVAEEPAVRASLTGMPVYAVDDRQTIQRDLGRLSAVSFVLVLFLFVTAFGALRRPLLAMVALALGVAATVGAVSLYPGHLTLLSAFFASILFGLGVDYGVHLVDRIEEEVAAEMDEREAVATAVEALAPGLLTGAGTTASVLFAMVFSGFRGFEELGVVAGTGVVLCLLAMVTLLPALLVLWPPARRRERPLMERRLGRFLVTFQNRPVAAGVALLVAVAAFAGGPGFDGDYLNLQPVGSEAVRLERLMVEESSWSPEFAVFTTDDEDRARQIVEQLVDDETVAAVRSMVELEALGAAEGLPPSLAAGLRSPEGRYAVYAYPAEDVWRPAAQERFLEHLRAVDPEVTGMPVLGSFMVQRSRRALRITAALGLVLLALWVGWDFRRWQPALLAILPAVLTVVSLHGLMRFFQVPFNSLNLMALPVVLGVAVDDGVHIVHRFLAERGDLRRTLSGTGRSVLLTSLTTLAAFGTLALTGHRGLASFGKALALGVAAALVISVLLLPELLVLCRRWLLDGHCLQGDLALGPGGGEKGRHVGAPALLPGAAVDQVRDRQVEDAHAEGAEDDGAVLRRRRGLPQEHLAEGGADEVAVAGGLRRQVDGSAGAADMVEVVDHIVVGQDGLRQ